MPKSKRSSKRRAKLKKRGNKTYNWAVRKVHNLSQMSEEELEKYLASLQPGELKTTGWKKIEAAETEEEEEEDDLQG